MKSLLEKLNESTFNAKINESMYYDSIKSFEKQTDSIIQTRAKIHRTLVYIATYIGGSAFKPSIYYYKMDANLTLNGNAWCVDLYIDKKLESDDIKLFTKQLESDSTLVKYCDMVTYETCDSTKKKSAKRNGIEFEPNAIFRLRLKY